MTRGPPLAKTRGGQDPPPHSGAPAYVPYLLVATIIQEIFLGN